MDFFAQSSCRCFEICPFPSPAVVVTKKRKGTNSFPQFLIKSLLLSVDISQRHPERSGRSGKDPRKHLWSVRPALHLPALVPGAHGLPLNPPGALLVGAVADGALVRLHFPPSGDDSGLGEAVWAWKEETNCT